MPQQYRVQAHGAGPWAHDEIVDAAAVQAHPFGAKWLRTGSLVPISAEASAATDAKQQAALADLDVQIATLTARRATLLAEPVAPTAPGAVAYQLDRTDQPDATAAAAARAAGSEVIQPSPGAPVTGTVVPGEAAPPADPPAGKGK